MTDEVGQAKRRVLRADAAARVETQRTSSAHRAAAARCSSAPLTAGTAAVAQEQHRRLLCCCGLARVSVAVGVVVCASRRGLAVGV